MSSLFDPLQHGAIRAANRVLMAPLTRARATRDHVPTPIMADYYRQRASAGLIISEATGISRQGLGWPYAPGLWSDEQVAKGMHRLRDVVERAESSARGEVTRTPDAAEEVMPVPNAGSLGLSDSLRRAENLYARLTDLAAVLAEAPVRPAVSRRAAGRGRRPSVPESLP